MVATEIAEQLQETQVEETGKAEHPIEEQADPPHGAPTVPNPADPAR